MIAGQVVDANGAPVSEAIVMLQPPATAETIRTTVNPRVMADREGRFFFADLPAGRYGVQATRTATHPGGTASGGRGATAPLRSSSPTARGAPTSSSASGIRSDQRHGCGRSRRAGCRYRGACAAEDRHRRAHALWEPAVHSRARAPRDHRRPRDVPFHAVVAGHVRRSGAIDACDGTVANLVNLETTVRNDLFRAGISEITPPGSPRTLSMGDFALMTLNRV